MFKNFAVLITLVMIGGLLEGRTNGIRHSALLQPVVAAINHDNLAAYINTSLDSTGDFVGALLEGIFHDRLDANDNRIALIRAKRDEFTHKNACAKKLHTLLIKDCPPLLKIFRDALIAEKKYKNLQQWAMAIMVNDMYARDWKNLRN